MPSLFEKIGKATKDLFNEDYSLKNQLKISQKASNGTSLQATATTNGAGLKSELKTTIKASDVVSVETKIDCCNKVSFKIDYTELQNVKVVCNTSLPGVGSGDIEATWTSGGTQVMSNVGLSLAPKFVLSASNTTYMQGLTAGAELGYDAGKGAMTKLGVGALYKTGDLTYIGKLEDKLDTLKASVLHQKSDTFTWAAEYLKKMSKGETTMTLGSSFKVDDTSSVKAKLDNHGIVTALYKLEIKKGTTFACSAELNSLDLQRAPKLGFNVTLK